MERKLTKADIDAIKLAVWAKAPNVALSTGIGKWLLSKLLTVTRYLGLK